MRQRNKLCIVLGIAAVAMWGLSHHFLTRINDRAGMVIKREQLATQARIEAGRVSGDIWAKMRNAQTPEEWERILIEELPLLDSEYAKFPSVVSKAKLFEARFWAGEYLLVGASRLLQYDVHHPVAKKYIQAARELYEKNDDIVNHLHEDSGNTQWNAYLHYLQGVYYFRSLFFVKEPAKEQSKVEELIAQSALHLGKVFAWLPKDNDAQVALELLQKKAQELLTNPSNADEQLRLQLKLLPSKEVGPEFLLGGKEGKH